jgi:hypothetical protein
LRIFGTSFIRRVVMQSKLHHYSEGEVRVREDNY